MSTRALPQLRPVPVLGALGFGAISLGRSLPDSRLFDRLLRGRAWVLLIGVLLIGLVAINVSLLKLNSEAGRNAEKAKALEIQNTQLRAKVSQLASSERLQRAGRELGLAMSIAGRVRYVSVRPSDGRRAARALRSGAPANFAFAPLPAAPAAPAALTQAGESAPAVEGTQPAPSTPESGTPAAEPPGSGAPTPAASPPGSAQAPPAGGTGVLPQAQTGVGDQASPSPGG